MHARSSLIALAGLVTAVAAHPAAADGTIQANLALMPGGNARIEILGDDSDGSIDMGVALGGELVFQAGPNLGLGFAPRVTFLRDEGEGVGKHVDLAAVVRLQTSPAPNGVRAHLSLYPGYSMESFDHKEGTIDLEPTGFSFGAGFGVIWPAGPGAAVMSFEIGATGSFMDGTADLSDFGIPEAEYEMRTIMPFITFGLGRRL